jgi:hypothetical protein
MRKLRSTASTVTSLLEAPSISAPRMLMACVPGTMSFWVDHHSAIHVDVPDNIPASVAHLIVGTYGVGTPAGDIEDDLRATRCERARSWITD